jgi:hypothetical protein
MLKSSIVSNLTLREYYITYRTNLIFTIGPLGDCLSGCIVSHVVYFEEHLSDEADHESTLDHFL